MNNRELMHKLITVSLLHRHYIRKNACAAGLYAGQPPVLEYLKDNGPSTQKEIADALYVSPASMAVSIKRLEKNGFVSRESDENDRRKNTVALTAQGLAALEKFYTICGELDDKVFHGIDERELQSFEETLKKMITNLVEGKSDAEISDFFAKLKRGRDDSTEKT